ncbi:MAG: hypothetical protein NTW51_04780 [Cyanobacteria bacterium]|nr:hypothetical protein [Cyanobacteriota bacterium]
MQSLTPRHHVIITGTGRAGTTFLVELLTNLGLDTGFNSGNLSGFKNEIARAGLEKNIGEDNCGYIVKNPGFHNHAEELLSREDIIIDHVFVPMRDLVAAAESRRVVTRDNKRTDPPTLRLKLKLLRFFYGSGSFKRKIYAGGLIGRAHSGKSGKQEQVLLEVIYKLMLTLSKYNIPITLMQYPLITKESQYLYRKLSPILNGISFDSFREVFDKTVKPELVHSYTKNDTIPPQQLRSCT